MALTLVATYPSSSFSPTVISPSSKIITNTQGNLLVLFAAWDTSFSTGSTQPVPSSNVCDSQGNWWRLAGDTGTACEPCRCTIWVCQNALAIPSTGWVSFATEGYVTAGLWTIAEFSGLPAGYVPVFDFMVPKNTGTGTASSLSLSALTSQADYAFAMAAQAGISTSITASPGAPWTTLATASNVTVLETLSASCSYATAASGTTLTPSWTFSTAVAAAALVVGISQASSPPSQSNVNFPAVKVEAAFGANAGDPSVAILDTTWTDITSRALSSEQVVSINYTRGRQYELGTPESGTLTVMLNNQDGAFNPTYPGSPYYSNALNSNMSFQRNVNGWIPYDGAAIKQSSAFTLATGVNAVAQFSMQVTFDGVTSFAGMATNISANVNNTYSGSFWIFTTTGIATGTQLLFDWQTAGGVHISSNTTTLASVAANQWIQVTLLNVTPPANTGILGFNIAFPGTPSASNTCYIAEAAVVTGASVVQTGLVRLGTPVRVSAYWQGRQYAVAYGITERLPQTWPDLPQWGFSNLIATDQAGAAAIVTLPSAVQGEILADAPYACLPFNDQYSTAVNTVNGAVKSASTCAGFAAVNTSRVNQQAGVYTGSPVMAGQSITLAGDSGTGMGVSTYSTVDTSGLRGGGAIYGPDSGLPPTTSTTGSTYEYWVSVPSGPTNPGSGSQFFSHLQLFMPPNIGSVLSQHMPGWLITVGMVIPPVSGGPNLFAQQSSAASPTTITGFSYNTSHHVVVTIDTNGTTTVFLDTNSTLLATTVGLFAVNAVAFGGGPYSYGNAYTNWNYSMAYGTVYPYVLPVQRIQSHFSSGSQGFSGDWLTQRFARYLAWGGVGLNPGGPGQVSDAFRLAGAYSTSGSTLASALNSDTQSSGGVWYASAGGNLIIVPRPALYGLLSTITFGDNTAAGEIPSLQATGFDYDNTYLSNVVQTTLVQGASTSVSPIEKNFTSIAEYGTRGPLTLQVSGNTAEDAYDAATWLLNAYSQPSLRVQQLTVDAASYPTAFSSILPTDITSIATVNRRPIGGAPYSLLTIIQRVEGQIGPGQWQVTYQMSPYTQQSATLITDTSGNDVLGSNTLAW